MSASQHPRPGRGASPGRLLAAAALVVVAVLALLQPGAAQKPDRARIEPTAAKGSLSLSNSRGGGAIFSASNMAPGDSTTGSVTIGNTGTVAGRLELDRSQLEDVAGLHGGVLSRRLDLTVAHSGTTLYSGQLADMPRLSAGTLGPGESRTYSFTVSLPDGGDPADPETGDNLYLGGSVKARYDWVATGDEPAEKPAPAPSKPSVAPKRPQPWLAVRLPRKQRILSQRKLAIEAECTRRCRIEAQAQLLRVRADRRRVLTKKALRPKTWTRMELPLSRPSVKRIRRGLLSGQTVTLRLVVQARDDKGEKTVARRRVKMKIVRRAGRTSVAVR